MLILSWVNITLYWIVWLVISLLQVKHINEGTKYIMPCHHVWFMLSTFVKSLFIAVAIISNFSFVTEKEISYFVLGHELSAGPHVFGTLILFDYNPN